jgi:hypothetical protein
MNQWKSGSFQRKNPAKARASLSGTTKNSLKDHEIEIECRKTTKFLETTGVGPGRAHGIDKTNFVFS